MQVGDVNLASKAPVVHETAQLLVDIVTMNSCRAAFGDKNFNMSGTDVCWMLSGKARNFAVRNQDCSLIPSAVYENELVAKPHQCLDRL